MNAKERVRIEGVDEFIWILEVYDDEIRLCYEEGDKPIVTFIPSDFDTYYTIREFLKTHTVDEITDSVIDIAINGEDELVSK